jgi:hypothetical protein
MYITDAEETCFSCVCLGKVKGDARANQLITFTRFLSEADTAVEEDMVERAIGVHENLSGLAANVFKLRHNSPEIVG